MEESKYIACSIKHPVPIRVGDPKEEFHSGCSVVDISFPNLFYVEIGEIHFKNYYTASLSLQARVKSKPAEGGEMKWQTVIKRMQLMPSPHCDSGSEDYFSIPPKQLGTSLSNIMGLRFVLRQPSPMWKEFRIDDIRLYKTAATIPQEVAAPNWITDASKQKEDDPNRQLKGVSSIPALSKDLQQLWALAGQVEAPKSTLGRYDVDGSYEINLLSYT